MPEPPDDERKKVATPYGFFLLPRFLKLRCNKCKKWFRATKEVTDKDCLKCRGLI